MPIDSESTSTSRRALLTGSVAAATATLLPTVALADDHDEAGVSTQDLQGAGFYRFNIGKIEAAVLGDGLGAIPGPAFGTNQQPDDVNAFLQTEFLPTDRVPTHFLAMALKMPTGEMVLIDTGTGAPVSNDDPTPRLIRHLKRLGIDPGDVTHVIFSHGHGDHIGGAFDASGKPNFANASLHMNTAERDFWADPDFSKSTLPQPTRDALAAAGKQFLEHAGDTLQTFDYGDALIEGIVPIVASGHTPGHTAFEISNGSDLLLHVADAIFVPQIAHPDWHYLFDTAPAESTQTRQQLLARAAEAEMMIHGNHLPFPALGHVRAAGDGFQYVPVTWRW